ncbi:MAG: AAA family ATPase [Bacilli bacterium]|nr:AAA family ATPase [Bacilli bacterium]
MNDDLNKISILRDYGEDMSSKKFIVNPAIAREEEIKKMILTLLIPEKSAILVGKPGIGKTAIVEGLAYRMQNNDIPEALKDFKIIKINTGALVGTANHGGNTDSKIQLMMDELKQTENIILFIDEIHTVIGTAGANSALDFANILKAGLDRGTIKIIGATTTEEYDHYIVKDRAFLRRFEKIEVDEPTAETTVKILLGTIPKIEAQTGAKLEYSDFVKENIVKFMVNMTSEYKRIFGEAARYPDVTLLLLAKCFSFATYDNCTSVKFKHIWEAIKACQSVYPDVLTKEKIIFKRDFAEFLETEKVDLSE